MYAYVIMSLCHAGSSARCLDASSLLGKFFPADSHCRRDGSWSCPSRFALMILTHLACKPEIQAENSWIWRRKKRTKYCHLQTTDVFVPLFLYILSTRFLVQTEDMGKKHTERYIKRIDLQKCKTD